MTYRDTGGVRSSLDPVAKSGVGPKRGVERLLGGVV